MNGLFIVPICVGHMLRDKSCFHLGRGRGVMCNYPIISWYVGGAEKKIIIDTGISAPQESASFHMPVTQSKQQTLSFAIEQLGLKPEDIDVVINTHLHWDHCYNNNLLPNAKFYVQRRELEYAVAPLPAHYHGYEALQLGMRPPFASTKWEHLDGDAEICPGVSLVFIPGHTPGSQGVLIESSTGSVFVASDTLATFECWGPEGVDGAVPNGCYTDLEDYYRSFERISDISKKVDLLLPGHDQLVFEVDHPSIRQLLAEYAIPASALTRQ